jgi:diguanylate cyclase (GGDEF)-like protein/PAS domain S-box-containing protein
MMPLESARIDVHSALAMTSRAVVISDATRPDNPIVFINKAFAILTGYDEEECIGRNCRFLQGPDSDRQVITDIRNAISCGASIRREILNYHKTGTPFWNDVTIDPIRDDVGAIIGFIGVQHDSTSSRAAHDAMIEAEQRLNDITSHVPGYVYRRLLKPDGTLELAYLSQSFNAMLGLPLDDTLTITEFYKYVHRDDLGALKEETARSAADLSMFHEEFRLISPAGSVHWVRSDAPARRLPNGDVIWDGLAIEITKEKATEADLAFLAFHDSLTGLSNRVRFKNSLSDAIEKITEGERIGIFFIDVDDFQDVNDAFGQPAGDGVLRAIGQRLKTLVESEGGTVARLGGDEFAVLVPAMSAVGSITGFASVIAHELAKPMPVLDREITVQVCVGATMFPSPDDKDPLMIADPSTELIKRTDLALHHAKQDGPGSQRLYDVEFDDRIHNRVALRQSLHLAIEEQQFELHYHPLVELSSGRIVGAEALVRWNHPELGMQRPDLFIPLAEASGLIVPLGAWVITQAMRQHETWRQQGLNPPRIAINLSNVQLKRADFLAVVERALADTGADPSGFEFELTEGLLIESSPDILDALRWLKSLGFWITVDDFGTGYSTFKYLRDFPVDKVKIDQTFVRQLVIDSSDASIVQAMIGLSRSLGIKIVAEGIETEMQRDFLREEGCEIGQGYFFSLPLTAEDFGWLIQRNVALPIST